MKKININPKKDLVFNIKVAEACKSCKRYGTKACCPPYIGNFKYYKKLLPTYKYGIFYIMSFKIKNKENWKKLGKESSIKLHKKLLKDRDNLFNKGHYFNIILGGGSCKYCEKCVIPCRFPQFRAIPIEATGIDVVQSLKKQNIKVKFPVKTYFNRIGLILYD